MFRDEKIDVYRVTSCCMVLSQLEFQVKDQSANILGQTVCENISSKIFSKIFWLKHIVKIFLLRAWVRLLPPSRSTVERRSTPSSTSATAPRASMTPSSTRNTRWEQFIIFMELNGIDLGRNGMGVQDAEHQLLRGQHRLDHQEHLWSSLPLHCRHVQQHFVSKISIQFCIR